MRLNVKPSHICFNSSSKNNYFIMKRRMENKNFVSENICTSAPKHFAKHIFSGLAIISHNDIFLN